MQAAKERIKQYDVLKKAEDATLVGGSNPQVQAAGMIEIRGIKWIFAQLFT